MSGEPPLPRGSRRSGPSPLSFVGLGFEIVAPVVLLMFVGHGLDGWLQTTPGFLIAGAILGSAVGFWSFFRRVLPPRDEGEDRGRR